MLLQVGKDPRAWWMLSLSQITTITGARGNAWASIASSAMKSAAQRRPSRYTQRPVVTSIAPNTVTCRFLPGVRICGRVPPESTAAVLPVLRWHAGACCARGEISIENRRSEDVRKPLGRRLQLAGRGRSGDCRPAPPGACVTPVNGLSRDYRWR
jgi:hypothetical protein